MKKEDLEKLIADKPLEVKAKGILLFNGYAQAMSKLNAESSVPNRKNYQSAEKALNEYVIEIGGINFPTPASVLRYLQKNGYKITKSTLDRHCKNGKLPHEPDGTYSLKQVTAYAADHVKQLSTGQTESENVTELQRKKLEKELEHLSQKIEREKFSFEKEQGLFIPKDQMEIELASRAGILVAGLKHWVQSNAADWIAAVSGETKKTGELINLMSKDVDEHINHYASSREYEVVIEKDPNVQTDQ